MGEHTVPAVTVVGGGLAGLVAAITAAERGAKVRLFEAHATLGGRWRSTAPPYVVHSGPHVLYRDGPIWPWLKRRDLLGTTCAVPHTALTRFHFRRNGSLRRTPPRALVRALTVRKSAAPADRSYLDWASDRWGAETALLSAAATGVGVFHHNPGELSAQFVWERFRRVFAFPPAAGYQRGGWGNLFEALGSRARSLGVDITLGTRLTQLPDGTTIVATELESARALLREPTLDWPSGRAALLDLGLLHDRRDAFVVSDLDDAGWLERFTVADPTLAPPGQSVVQLQVPLRPGESTADGIARVEALADLALPDWRQRVTFRRDAVANHRTGAVDYPGTTWHDRPAIDRGNGVYLVGDRVAAPGLLSEVSFSSAVQAATSATRSARETRKGLTDAQ